MSVVAGLQLYGGVGDVRYYERVRLSRLVPFLSKHAEQQRGTWSWHRRCMRRSNACNEICAEWQEAAGMWLSTDVKAIEMGRQ